MAMNWTATAAEKNPIPDHNNQPDSRLNGRRKSRDGDGGGLFFIATYLFGWGGLFVITSNSFEWGGLFAMTTDFFKWGGLFIMTTEFFVVTEINVRYDK